MKSAEGEMIDFRTKCFTAIREEEKKKQLDIGIVSHKNKALSLGSMIETIDWDDLKPNEWNFVI